MGSASQELKMIKFWTAFLISFAVTLTAQEVVNLTTPITYPSQTTVKIERVTIDVVAKIIRIQWLGENGEAGSAIYDSTTSPTGAALLTTLNKMNFSGGNPSLVNRILTRLQLSGHIGNGSISGTPE